MRREDLSWIIPLLEKLRDNPDAQLLHYETACHLEHTEFISRKAAYSVHIPRKYRLYKRHGSEVFCLTSDEARVPTIEKDPSVTWLTDWLPVPTGP